MYFTSKSVLNTDLFDQRRYDEILQMSKKMQEIDKLGRQILPSFSPLMGDIWASLFKSSPEVLEETSDELMVNKHIMKRVMKDEQFETYRETTKLDDLASAIGTLTFSEKTYQWLEQQERKNLEYAEKIGQYRELMKQAMEKKEKAEKQQEKAQLAKEKSNVNAEKLQQQADQLEQKAELAFQQATETGESIAQMLEQMMQGQKFQAMAEQSIKDATDTIEAVTSLIGGFEPGNQKATMQKVPLRDQITLAEKLMRNKKIKKIAEWAGRFKLVARKKQKSKHNQTIDRSGVELGTEVERLLPAELAAFSHSSTRLDFLRRYAEGQTMMYAPKGKEVLGKGPVIFVLDQSGSARKYDDQAKGFALALMSIAKKQRRDFALVLFSSQVQVKIYEKGKLHVNDLIDMATTFLDGGTEFRLALHEVTKIIEKSRFKNADVVFTTDGEDKPGPYIDKFNAKKAEKQFKVLSLILGNGQEATVKKFSEEIIRATSFNDMKVMEKAFKI